MSLFVFCVMVIISVLIEFFVCCLMFDVRLVHPRCNQVEFDKLFKDLDRSWHDLGGNETIEKNWYNWTIDETIAWFEYTLKTQDLGFGGNDYYSSGESSDDDNSNSKDSNYNSVWTHTDTDKVDFDINSIKKHLVNIDFKAKNDLPMLMKSFQFKRFGFNNENDCKILCIKTRQLLKKYPKKSKGNYKKKNTNKNNDNSCDNGYDDNLNLEGFVQDTKPPGKVISSVMHEF